MLTAAWNRHAQNREEWKRHVEAFIQQVDWQMAENVDDDDDNVSCGLRKKSVLKLLINAYGVVFSWATALLDSFPLPLPLVDVLGSAIRSLHGVFAHPSLSLTYISTVVHNHSWVHQMSENIFGKLSASKPMVGLQFRSKPNCSWRVLIPGGPIRFWNLIWLVSSTVRLIQRQCLVMTRFCHISSILQCMFLQSKVSFSAFY